MGIAQQTQQQMEYMVSRRSWIGDYLDPNTFLDLYVTGGQNNAPGLAIPNTTSSSPPPPKSPTQKSGCEMLEQAERILMDEMPIIPIYYYVSRNLVKPYVRGWYNNLQDHHPLRAIWIDRSVDPNDPRPNEFMGRDAMTAFVVRRLIGLVATVWIVFTVTFFLMHAVPGGPFSSERKLDPEIEANLQAGDTISICPFTSSISFNWVAPCGAIWGPAIGLADFPVTEIIAQGLPMSAALGVLALAFAIVLGMAAGIVSAVYRGSLPTCC